MTLHSILITKKINSKDYLTLSYLSGQHTQMQRKTQDPLVNGFYVQDIQPSYSPTLKLDLQAGSGRSEGKDPRKGH